MSSKTLHMVYHVAPFGNYVWNLQELSKYVGVFTGHKIIGLATVPHIDTAKVVARIRQHLGKDVEIVIEPNDRVLREAKTFIPAMQRVDRLTRGGRGFVWYGHTKGVTHTTPRFASSTKVWTASCYHYTLSPDYLKVCLAQLDQGYVMTGPFKRYGLAGNFPKQKSLHHYSGTFFWLEGEQFFNSPWEAQFKPHRYGVEALPGLLFDEKECACSFGDGVKDLYTIQSWYDLIGVDAVEDILYGSDKTLRGGSTVNQLRGNRPR